MEVVLCSSQVQEPDEMEQLLVSSSERPPPVVNCSFVAEFHNPVCLQADFKSQIIFLPNLLKDYLSNPVSTVIAILQSYRSRIYVINCP